MTQRMRWCLFTFVAAFVVVLGMLVMLAGAAPRVAAAAPQATVLPPGLSDLPAWVHLLDRSTGDWVFSFTLPGTGANLQSVDVVSQGARRDVWFTESGRDRIGRLAYTSTVDYDYSFYTLLPGDEPLNLIVSGGWVWFTAPGGDYVGRLNPATGAVDRFAVPAGSYPADLTADSNGGIWFTQMLADKLARLEVASAAVYTITEHNIAAMNGGRPYGVVARTDTYGVGVYFAETAHNLVRYFNPGMNEWKSTAAAPTQPVEPYALTVDGTGKLWGAERAGNMVSQFYAGTMPLINRYSVTPVASLPNDIAADADNAVWFTQPHAGQVGSLSPAVPPQRTYYPLPLPDLAPMGLAVDGDDVWVVSTARIYANFVPVVLKSVAN